MPLSGNYTVRVWIMTHAPAEDVLARMDSGVDCNDTAGELLTLRKYPNVWPGGANVYGHMPVVTAAATQALASTLSIVSSQLLCSQRWELAQPSSGHPPHRLAGTYKITYISTFPHTLIPVSQYLNRGTAHGFLL